ncbi:MAG: hypothetical protein ACTSQ6_07860 [Candidatus Heimdallarchaeaceae archaeon]
MIQKNPYDNWGKEAYIDKDDLPSYPKNIGTKHISFVISVSLFYLIFIRDY